jgi:hypothetical protein
MGKFVREGAGAGAGIFDNQEPELEQDKNGPAPQHWFSQQQKIANVDCMKH